MLLYEKSKLAKEIVKKSFKAQTIISDTFSIYQILKATKKTLPFKPKAEKRFNQLITFFQNSNHEDEIYMTHSDANELVDYINLFITHEEELKRLAEGTRIESSKLLEQYARTLKGIEKTNILVQQNKRKELLNILKVSGVNKDLIKQAEKANVKDLESYVTELARVQAKNETSKTVSFDSISTIQQNQSKVLNTLSRSSSAIQKDPTKKFAKVKKFGNFLANQIDFVDDFKRIWELDKKQDKKSLSQLTQEEALIRIEENNKENLKELTKTLLDKSKEDKDKQDEKDKLKHDEQKQLTEQGNDIARLGFNESISELEAIKENTGNNLVHQLKTNDLLQKLINNSEKALNEAELERLKNSKKKDDKKDEETDLFEDISDLFSRRGIDVDTNSKKDRKRNKGKKPKPTKTIRAGKGGLIRKTAGLAVEAGSKVVQGLGGLAKGAGNAIAGAGRAGLGALTGLAKFAGPAGLALTAGMAVKDAYDGFDENKANQLGFDGKTTKGKTDSAVSHALSGATFGLVDPETVAGGLKFKDNLDKFLVGLVGGEDSLLGSTLDKVLSPMDNLSKAWDGITGWFSDDKEEKEKQKEKDKAEEKQQKSVTNQPIANLQNPNLTQTNLLDPKTADPLATGFQNMFDYMAQVPGIGEFFKDKTSGKVNANDVKKAQEFFNPLSSIFGGLTGGIFGTVTNALGSIFGKGNTSNVAQYHGGSTGGAGAGGSWGDPNKNMQGSGSAKDARDAYIKLAKEKGRSEQDIKFALANMAEETGNFTRAAQEDMNYTSVKQIMSVHGAKIRKWGGDVNTLVKNPEALANVVYSDHNGSRLGNTQQGDGWRFRGRGLVQLTGRENYRKIGKKIGVDLENNPDLANDPQVAAKIADVYLAERSYGKSFEKFTSGIIGNNTTNTHGIESTQKRRGHLASVEKLLNQSSPIATKSNSDQTANPISEKIQEQKHVTTDGLKKGVTKVNEQQRQAIKSGKLNLKVNQEAQAMNGYDPNQRYFEAPKGTISKNDVTKLDPVLYQNLNKMAHAYQTKTGKRLIVTNSYRSYEEQKALYDSPKYKANRPGYSLHEYGLAVDIKPEQAGQLEKSGMLKEFGFYRPLPNDKLEQQHVQPLSISGSELASAGDSQVAKDEKQEQQQEQAQVENLPEIPKQDQQVQTQGLSQGSGQSPQSIVDSGATQASSMPMSTLGNTLTLPKEQNVNPSDPVLSTGISKPEINFNLDNFRQGIENFKQNPIQSIIENVPTAVQAVKNFFTTEKQEDVIPSVPTAFEQQKIETARQLEIAKASSPNIAIANQGSSGAETTGFNTGVMFDDVIDDIGLAMFNKMQLG